MLVKEMRNPAPPKGFTYCQTPWAKVIHLTRDGKKTLCDNLVAFIMTDMQAEVSQQNVCHGCFRGK